MKRRSRGRGKGKFIIAGIAAVAIAAAGFLVYGHIQEQKVVEEYNTAVNYILEEDFSDAKATLGEIPEEAAEDVEEVEDVDALTKYAKVQMSIDSCAGRPDKFQAGLEKVGDIENAKVSKQYAEAVSQTEDAESIQDRISEIDYEHVTTESKGTLTEISDDIDHMDDRYEVLVDAKRLEDAETMVFHMEKGDSVGKVMTDISRIGEVKLDSESKVGGIRTAYDKLSDNEQELVLNYTLLTSAETALSKLRKEKAEKEKREKEKKEAEERERLAAEKAKKEAEEEPSVDRSVAGEHTVYKTETGTKYHSAGCRYLKKSSIPISLEAAQGQGLTPCSVCNP